MLFFSYLGCLFFLIYSGEAFSGQASMIDSSQLSTQETKFDSFYSAVNCISGNRLREIVLNGFLKRIAAHLSLVSDLYLSSESHLTALKWLLGASDVSWRLFRESNPNSQEVLACCIGHDQNFVTLTLSVLCIALQLYGKLQPNILSHFVF